MFKCILDNPLTILYPVLYECFDNKEACISVVLGHQTAGTNRVWNLRFYRDFHDWELEDVYSFLNFIKSRISRDFFFLIGNNSIIKKIVKLKKANTRCS